MGGVWAGVRGAPGSGMVAGGTHLSEDYMSLINEILATGRQLGAVEADLVRLDPRDSRRARLSQRAGVLQARQTEQIAAALAAGVDEGTVRFALALHGQGA